MNGMKKVFAILTIFTLLFIPSFSFGADIDVNFTVDNDATGTVRGYDQAEILDVMTTAQSHRTCRGIYPTCSTAINSSASGNPQTMSAVFNSNPASSTVSFEGMTSASAVDDDFFIMWCSAINYGGDCIHMFSTQTSNIWESTGYSSPTNTRFVFFTPPLGTTTPNATSSSFTIGVFGYINSVDHVASSTELYVRWRQSTGMGLRGNPSTSDWGEHEFDVEDSGYFDLESDYDIQNTGVYNAYFQLRKPLINIFGFQLFHRTILDSIGTFVVGEVEPEEIEQVQAIFDNPGGINADVTVPTDANATSTLFGLGRLFDVRNTFMDRFPINWVLEYASVLQGLASTTATTTIPSVDIEFGQTALDEITGGHGTTSTTTFSLFSAETIEEVSEIPGIQFARTFVSWTLWISLIFFAWREAVSLFATKVENE